MRGSRKFYQRGSNFDNVFFLVDKERETPNTTINGPSSARQRYPIKLRANDGPTLNVGLVAL